MKHFHKHGLDLEITKGEKEGGRDKLGSKCYIQQINKDLLYSTGDYTQYLTITYNGIQSEKTS